MQKANVFCAPMVAAFMDFATSNPGNVSEQQDYLLYCDKKWERFIKQNGEYIYDAWETYFLERVRQTRALIIGDKKEK